MKLRRSFSSHQLIFAFGFALFTLSLAPLSTPSAWAQDTVVLADQTVNGKIVGVESAKVVVQIGAGKLAYPLTSVRSVTMPAPADFEEGKKAYAEKNYGRALAVIRGIVTKYNGLPTDWARESASLLGDLYVALDKLPEAEAAYLSYQKAYGGAGTSIQTEVGLARIALSRKEYDKVKTKLEPIITRAMGEKNPDPSLVLAYSQASYLRGRAEEAQQDYKAALEDYTRTVALFYHDPAAVADARTRAEALRKEHGVTTP